MAKCVLSIEVNGEYIVVSEVIRHSKNSKILNYEIIDVPEHSIEDGVIINIKKVAFAINKVIKDKDRKKKFKAKEVIFTLNSNKIITKEVTQNYISEKKIKGLVELNAVDYFPMTLENYYVTYMLLDYPEKGKSPKVIEGKKKNGTNEKNVSMVQIRFLLLAVHNELLTSYYQLADEIGLRIESMDFIGNSILQFSKEEKKDNKSLMIYIGTNTTVISIINRNTPKQLRMIPYGTDNIISIAREQEYFASLSKDEILTKLSKESMFHPQFNGENEIASALEIEFPDNEYTLKLDAMRLLTSSLFYMYQIIERAVNNYGFESEDNILESLSIIGIGSNIKGLNELLSNELQVTYKSVHNLSHIQSKKLGIDNITMDYLLPAYSATIAPLRLITKEMEKSKEYKILTSRTILSTIIILGFLGLYITYSNQQLKILNEEKDILTRRIQELSSIEIIIEEYQVISEFLDVLTALEYGTRSGNDEIVELLEGLEQYLPRSIVIHSIRSSSLGISMDITAPSKEEAAFTILQLRKIPIITNVTSFSIVEEVNEIGQVTVNFSISAEYTSIKEEVIVSE